MAKSSEQLDARNEEVKPEEVKFAKLNEKDLEQVSGGTRKRLFFDPPTYVQCPDCHEIYYTSVSPTICPVCGCVFDVIIG